MMESDLNADPRSLDIIKRWLVATLRAIGPMIDAMRDEGIPDDVIAEHVHNGGAEGDTWPPGYLELWRKSLGIFDNREALAKLPPNIKRWYYEVAEEAELVLPEYGTVDGAHRQHASM